MSDSIFPTQQSMVTQSVVQQNALDVRPVCSGAENRQLLEVSFCLPRVSFVLVSISSNWLLLACLIKFEVLSSRIQGLLDRLGSPFLVRMKPTPDPTCPLTLPYLYLPSGILAKCTL